MFPLLEIRMIQQLVIVLLAAVLLLPGCAAKNHDNADMKANLEPELWDTSIILKDLKKGRPLTEQEKKALASRGSIQFNLDVKENEEVQMFLQYFTMDKHGSMDKWLARAEPHLPYVRAVLASYNLPQDLIVLPIIESGYNNMAYSPVGAGGMWQFMPYTARRFGLTVDWWVDERRDPFKATVAAAKYLTKLYQMFGDWNLALAAYNAGEGKVSKAMACSGQTDFFDLARDPGLLKAETRHYVPKFLAVLKIFQNLDSLGFRKINWQAGPNLKEVSVPGGTDLLALAQACGISWEQFREQNAAFRRQVSPPDQAVNVYVPVAKEQLALAYLRDPGSRPPAGYQNYQAQAGETWWAISRRSGVPVAELRQLNASLPEVLGPGQAVRIPNSVSGEENTALADASDACAPVRSQAAAKPVRHRVNKGETVGSIAHKYGVSVAELKAANKVRSNHLNLGTTLIIPAASSQAVAEAARPAPAVQAKAGGTRHTVHRGESISGIATQYGVDTDDLLAVNHLRSGKDLKAGATLTIPGQTGALPTAKPAPEPRPVALAAASAKGSYQVKPGDTLSSISQHTGVDIGELKAANHLRSNDVRVGEKLLLPGAKAQPAPEPAPVAKAQPFREPTPKPLFAQAPARTVAAQAPGKPVPPQAPDKAVASAKEAPKSAAPAKPSGKPVNYKVNPGETVWGIAKKFNVEPSSLMAWNNMKSPGNLQAGTSLTIFKE
jgi:membrane-bound lytic murein transglycosylase D